MRHETRRQRLDRTDHQRAVRDQRRRGPPADAIADAADECQTHNVPGTPDVRALKVLRDGMALPLEVGDRKVVEASITDGDPQHGALRSDDHIGRYEVELPFAAVSPDTHEGDACHECGASRALYRYSANHHISGYERLYCLTCEEQVYSEDWG